VSRSTSQHDVAARGTSVARKTFEMQHARRRRRFVTLVLGVATLASADAALACPICISGTGDAVRAGLFGGDFVSTLLATLAPFPVLGAIVALLHHRGRR